ncbi:solute carrier family 31, member 2, isoform CRA_b [Rattus norvegicus]|uniref:Solute carrier family 31, member 2, isoform CRA_b n=1 Tax=Rattus norvegicus TaxID=10116 RepID=A6J7T7_RAT|nr:solute carrier family 31, member 2, isoform CRA_b [Rattus norvegicus]
MRLCFSLISGESTALQVVFVLLWPVASPCHSGGNWLLCDAGCHVLQHLDFPWCGPGLGCGLLPSLPTSPHDLVGQTCAVLRAGELGPLFQALYFSRLSLGWHCSPLPQFLVTEMKPAKPWSLEAMEATSLPSLYRAQASCGSLHKSL